MSDVKQFATSRAFLPRVAFISHGLIPCATAKWDFSRMTNGLDASNIKGL
jgi:hypothetical protein